MFSATLSKLTVVTDYATVAIKKFQGNLAPRLILTIFCDSTLVSLIDVPPSISVRRITPCCLIQRRRNDFKVEGPGHEGRVYGQIVKHGIL